MTPCTFPPLRFFLYILQAFSVLPAFPKAASLSSTELFSCRVNAKKEKIKRNRENMRKFSSPGKRGTSRRKVLKKAQASEARQKENEFISKCFQNHPKSSQRCPKVIPKSSQSEPKVILK